MASQFIQAEAASRLGLIQALDIYRRILLATNAAEIAKREKVALAAIRDTLGTEEGEYGPTLFVSHHLAEVDASYWQKHFGTEKPEPARVLDILELRSHWSDEDEEGIEVFDFTLPDGVTDYVISVRFDDAGNVEEISMES